MANVLQRPRTKSTTRLSTTKAGRQIDGRALLIAGLLGGVAFVGLELLATLLFGADSPLGPAYMMMRALEAGQGATEAHDPAVLSLGIMLHLFLAVLAMTVLVAVVNRWLTMPAVAVGFVYGVFLFVLTFLLAGGAGIPCWDACGATMMVNYGIFGALGTWIYKRWQRSEERS